MWGGRWGRKQCKGPKMAFLHTRRHKDHERGKAVSIGGVITSRRKKENTVVRGNAGKLTKEKAVRKHLLRKHRQMKEVGGEKGDRGS